MKNTLTVADFFCGAGGFSEGFRQNGFKIIFALDNWKPAVCTHRLNHPSCETIQADILELNTTEKIDALIPDTDIIIGSPPCVSFSGSNKSGKADKTLGIKLIKTFLGIIAWKKKKGVLKYWIFENVPNSKHFIKDSYTWKELGLLNSNEIAITIPTKEILNSAHYGAPQTRKRFFCGNYPSPVKTHLDENSWITIKNVQNHLLNPLKNTNIKEIKDPLYNIVLPKEKLTDHFYDTTISTHEWKKAKQLKEDHGFMGKMNFPENINKPSRTVLASMSASTRESIIFKADNVKNTHKYRLPTVREVACFMSFPISYQFDAQNESNKYRLVGNAVCCKVSSALSKAIAQKESIKIIQTFPKIILPPFDLTGRKKIIKSPKPRRFNAKFSRHIPKLKIKSFRIELSNRNSDFNRGNFFWTSEIHYKTGLDAVFESVPQAPLKKLLYSDNKFKTFELKLLSNFKGFCLTNKKLQESYVLNGNSKEISPDKVLQIIRETINEVYPYNKYSNINFEQTFLEKIKKRQVPFLILVGAYACNYFVSLIKKNSLLK